MAAGRVGRGALTAFNHIGVLGGGAWGTALAQAIAHAGRRCTLWVRRPDHAESIIDAGLNTAYLPGIRLDASIDVSADPVLLDSCEALVLAIPAQYAKRILSDLLPHLPMVPTLLAAKGINAETGALLSEDLKPLLAPRPWTVLSGPTFAAEVARRQPTAVTLAADDLSLAEALGAAIGSPTFRPYAATDPLGAEIGGAVKNVIAIACGIVRGRALGRNAGAALMTRGLAEITRLGLHLGAQPETFMGLSGLGDLTLTCNAIQSRNFSLGVALGEGQGLDIVLGSRRAVTEGVGTAQALARRAAQEGIDMPVAAAVNAVLHNGADIDSCINALLSRPLTAERL